MKTLVDYFEVHRAELQSQLVAADPSTVIARLQDEFGQLARLDGDYMRGLNVPQARLATSMLGACRTALGSLASAEPARHVSSARGEAETVGSGTSRLQVDGALLGAALGGALFGIVLGGIPGFLLGTAGGYVAGSAAHRFLPEPRPGNAEGVTKQAVDTEPILESLRQSFAMIDQAVAQLAASQEAATKVPGIEAFPEVLNFLQDLYCDVNTAQRIPAFLRQYGIKVEPYQPADQAPSIQDHFDFEEDYDEGSTTYTVLRPALLRDGQVLLRGRVALPIK